MIRCLTGCNHMQKQVLRLCLSFPKSPSGTVTDAALLPVILGQLSRGVTDSLQQAELHSWEKQSKEGPTCVTSLLDILPPSNTTACQLPLRINLNPSRKLCCSHSLMRWSNNRGHGHRAGHDISNVTDVVERIIVMKGRVGIETTCDHRNFGAENGRAVCLSWVVP